MGWPRRNIMVRIDEARGQWGAVTVIVMNKPDENKSERSVNTELRNYAAC
jgi:hypothetical protein